MSEGFVSDAGTTAPGPGSALAQVLGLTVGAWGAANVVGGSALALSASGARISAFGQQSAAWGAINVAIAGFGLSRARHREPDLAGLRRILLFNAALDVGYIAIGAAVARPERGRADVGAEARRGHGRAVMVQGAALLVIDSAYAAVATRLLRDN